MALKPIIAGQFYESSLTLSTNPLVVTNNDSVFAAIKVLDSDGNLCGLIEGNTSQNPSTIGQLIFNTNGGTFLNSGNGLSLGFTAIGGGGITIQSSFNGNVVIGPGAIINFNVPILPQFSGPALQARAYGSGQTGDLFQLQSSSGSVISKFDVLAKLTTPGIFPVFGGDSTGDIYYLNSGGALTRLGIGSTKNSLTIVGGLPVWAGTTMTLDTGWTANADGGDKTKVIPSNATLAAMATALNTLVAGFGDAFVATSEKLKAIETALSTSLLPNA